MKKIILFIYLIPVFALAKEIQIESTLIDPVFNRLYACVEHQAGQFDGLGDALGTDCFIVKSEETEGRSWLRSYRANGHKNEDWIGWKEDVLSPIDGTIKKININGKINEPGIKGSGTATFVVIYRDDGLHVTLAHAMDIKVVEGQKVKSGQFIGRIGNNGQSWHPHIHIGAWKNSTALQIRFNQNKIQNR